MPITRLQKEEIVKKLKDKIEKSHALVFAKFHGLSVAKIAALRRLFRSHNADYTVAKKTLMKIAFSQSGKSIPGDLEGEVGLIAGYGDQLGIFKTATEFAKKEKGAFQVLGGFFEGTYVDAETAKALGLIPSREALLAKLMQVIQGNTRKFVYILDQISKKIIY